MAAPKGNQFWKLRSKHGRDTLFANSEALWAAATEYFRWCDLHPWMKVEQAKGTPKPEIDPKTEKWVFPPNLVNIPTQRPYTLSGFMLYCHVNETYWRQFKTTEAAKHEDFPSVIAQIEETINTQQFEGATVGAFNANIISRKLGLADKVEQSGSVINYNHNANLTKEEIVDFSKALEDEY